MIYFGHMLGQQSADDWNTGYRAKNQSNPLKSFNGTAAVDIGAPSEAHVSAMADRDSTVEYQILKNVPQLAGSLANAMNSGNTTEAQSIGDQIDKISKDYAPYIHTWASINPNTIKDENGMVHKLIQTSRYLRSGSWKTGKGDLEKFSGGSVETSYNDFVNYDSEQSINNRTQNLRNNWDFDDDTSSMIADRVTYKDARHKVLREAVQPYVKYAGMISDAKEKFMKTPELKHKAHLAHEMWRTLDGLQLAEENGSSNANVFANEKTARDASKLIKMFLGTDPSASKDPPNLIDFQACAEAYFQPGIREKYRIEDFVSMWKKQSGDAAAQTQVKATTAADGKTVQVPVTKIDPRDVNKANVLRNLFVKKGYDVLDKGTTSAISMIIENQRRLGFDARNIGITMADWVDYSHAERTEQLTDRTEGAKKVEKLVKIHKTLRDRFGLTSITAPTGGKEGTSDNWIQSLNPAPDVFSGFSSKLAQDMFPALVKMMYEADSPDSKSDITPDKVYEALSGLDNEVIRSIERNAEGDTNAAQSVKEDLADYFYGKLTGNFKDFNNDGVGDPSVYKDFTTYSKVVMSKTDVLDREGNISSGIKTTPHLDYWGEGGNGKSAFVGGLIEEKRKNHRRFTELLGIDDESNVSVHTFNSAIKLLDVAGEDLGAAISNSDYRKTNVDHEAVRLLINLVEDDYSTHTHDRRAVSDDLAKSIARVMRGQILIAGEEGLWLEHGDNDVSDEKLPETRRRYRDVFNFCTDLAKVRKGEKTHHLSYLRRLSLAQDIAAQAFINLIQIDDSDIEEQVLGTVGPGYLETIQEALGPEFTRFTEKYYSVRNPVSALAAGWFDNEIEQGKDASYYDQLIQGFQADRDTVFKALNGEYTSAIKGRSLITMGASEFDPLWILQAMNNRAHEASEKKKKEEEARIGQMSSDPKVRVWSKVAGDIIDPDTIVQNAITQLMQASPDLEKLTGDSMFVNRYKEALAGQVSPWIEKLRSADPRVDKAKIAARILDIANKMNPVCFQVGSDTAGNPVYAVDIVSDVKKFYKEKLVPAGAKDTDEAFDSFVLSQGTLLQQYQDRQKLMKMQAEAIARTPYRPPTRQSEDEEG